MTKTTTVIFLLTMHNHTECNLTYYRY